VSLDGIAIVTAVAVVLLWVSGVNRYKKGKKSTEDEDGRMDWESNQAPWSSTSRSGGVDGEGHSGKEDGSGGRGEVREENGEKSTVGGGAEGVQQEQISGRMRRGADWSGGNVLYEQEAEWSRSWGDLWR
jgi:hypothetical protein